MKTLIGIIICTFFYSFTFSSNTNGIACDRLPDPFKFDSTTIIKYYHGGGMRYESLNIEVRFDSCIRVDMYHGSERRKAFAMTEEMRMYWEKIMREAGSSDIYSSHSDGFAHDKATTEICFGTKGSERCVSSGASTEVNEKSKVGFYKICDEIIKFSTEKNR